MHFDVIGDPLKSPWCPFWTYMYWTRTQHTGTPGASAASIPNHSLSLHTLIIICFHCAHNPFVTANTGLVIITMQAPIPASEQTTAAADTLHVNAGIILFCASENFFLLQQCENFKMARRRNRKLESDSFHGHVRQCVQVSVVCG